MVTVRRADERGHVEYGWLDTRHSFSFGDYHDPDHMGFRALRVINEDRVQAGTGFGKHPHRDMEILTYVLEGELAHKDSLGNGSVIRPGEVQRMSAGTGIIHSELNPSSDAPVHLLQIWLLPGQQRIKPGYEQKAFPEAERRNLLRLVASPDGREGSLTVHTDAAVYSGLLDGEREVTHALAPGRHAWVQVARGAVALNGARLEAGDGAAVSEEDAVTLQAREPAEVLLFDLA